MLDSGCPAGPPGGHGTGAAPIRQIVRTDETDTLINLAGSLLARTRTGITDWIPNGDDAFSTGFGAGTVTVKLEPLEDASSQQIEMHVFAPDGGLVAELHSGDLEEDESKLMRTLFESIRRRARNADSVVNGILLELGSPWAEGVEDDEADDSPVEATGSTEEVDGEDDPGDDVADDEIDEEISA